MTGPEQDTAEQAERSSETLTARCKAEELHVIDVAAAILRKPRSHFVVEAAVAAARQVLHDHNVELPSANVPA